MTKETSLQVCDIITTSNPVLADCPPIKEGSMVKFRTGW
jgi:hypothetical protein